MRHRRKGRVLGRSPSHRKALLRNLASSLFLTQRDAEFEENAPNVKGRITTTIQKAKEVQPLVEKCITIARKSLPAQQAAAEFEVQAERNSSDWKAWRDSEQWQKWNQAIAPAVAARRRALQLLGNKQAVQLLFDTVAPQMANRNGGYTRVLRLSKVRLGDAGEQAILEFVGQNDRQVFKSSRPAFDDESSETSVATEDDATQIADDPSTDAPEDSPAAEVAADDTAEPTGDEDANQDDASED